MSGIAVTESTVASLPHPSNVYCRRIIAENMKLLTKLEAGHSEGLTAHRAAMSRFESYSFGNILETARQRPDAARVASHY